MINLPFCPEHGLRVHKNGFVYYNGPSVPHSITATIRNLPFNANYYVDNVLRSGNKMESGRLCYESSEDAVSYNVFTALLADPQALAKLIHTIANKEIKGVPELYLWGGKIDLKNNKFTPYRPLLDVRKHLESDIKRFGTEPDIMLVIPKKAVICIEAKFGSKNPVARDIDIPNGLKPKRTSILLERYCKNNKLIDTNSLLNLYHVPTPLYEQLFRNIIFAASMAKLEGAAEWYVVNLRSQHVMNIKRGQPESKPIMRNMRSFLKQPFKKRFTHLTWEDIYNITTKNNPNLTDLTWYFKTKSLGCSRAFNIF